MSANPTIAVAMSGGVDSSTAAALLHAQGRPVVGLTMQLWNQRRRGGDLNAPAARGRCCSLDDVQDARRVAERLGIAYYVVNYEERFERDVVQPFVAAYQAGRTPIPCSLCNSELKFDQMLTTARQIGAERVATGHYARVRRDPETGRFELLRALDEAKDQTFFLWGLTQEQLRHAEFPLGELQKSEVRRQAHELGLAEVADKPDSNEICFIPDGDTAAFVAAYSGAGAERDAGEVVNREGKVLARHGGVHHFTVGQRKGLGIAAANPLYVLELDAPSQRVVVGGHEDLLRNELTASGCNWIQGAPPSGRVRVRARIRHRHTPAAAWAEALPENRLRLCFDEPQRAIAPGQTAVLYDGDLVLGGGWID
ncbi:MAG: tRNA 2-thiouridine(34) synthase MnmA [Terriglobales bacterium]